MQLYPRVVVRVLRLSSPAPEFRELSERNLDLVLGRVVKEATSDTELASEPLLDNRLVIAAGAHSPWARRRKIDLGDLVDVPWVLTPPECWIHTAIMNAFRTRGLKTPNVCLMTYSMPLRMNLAASGPYITAFPGSVRSLSAYRPLVRILPIDLPACPSPLAIITLKNRKLNPVAQRFIEHLRNYVTAEAC